ncbi:hypothetical protein [Streptomyces sp. NPDC006691]|uniref:hypothetical protein n=1 Tax=Streptomyces sp. NPDC006691 TaxID=3364757 RepID=UPI0036AFF1EF
MSTSDQEQAVGAAPEERGAPHTAEATVPGQASKASKRPSGERGATADGDPRGADAGAGAVESAGRAEGPSAAEATERAEAGGPEGGPAEPAGAAELPEAGGDGANAGSVVAVTPEESEPASVDGDAAAEPASAEPATRAEPASVEHTGPPEADAASRPRPELAETPGISPSADPSGSRRPEQVGSAQLPQGTGDFADADADAADGGGDGAEVEARRGMAPWMARRVRMVAAGVLMAAMGVILVVRLATRSSVLVVGVYGLALILCGVVIELSRNGRTRLGSWLLVVGLAAAFGMDWFVLP